MALRNILNDSDPGLLKKSRVVTDFNKRLHILLDDMRQTLIDAHGLGLAAPQVGVLRKAVLVVEAPDEPDDEDIEDDIDCDDGQISKDDTALPDAPVPDEDDDYDEESDDDFYNEKIVELINPELIFSEGEQCGSEGCLSMPGLFGLVKRPESVRVKAQDRDGNEFTFEAHGMTARAVCHEIDHLDGILFTSIAERMLTQEEVDEMRSHGNKVSATESEDEVEPD